MLNENDFNQIDISNKGPSNKSSGLMTDTEIKKVLDYCTEKGGFENITDTMVAIAGLCQVGATNKNAGKMLSYSYKTKTIGAKDFWDACQQAKKNGTPRQFARTKGSLIAKIAIQLQEPGDLARQMTLDRADLTMEEMVWCSNYQSTNPDCPEKVRNWLRDNFHKRFEN